ncbi:MAG: hypothetical protein WDO15_18395 [Bacteroidota bacterium]
MDKLLLTGRSMYAISMLALGFLCIQYHDFIVGRPPAWPVFTFNQLLGYSSGSMLCIASVMILINRNLFYAGLFIAAEILLLSVSRHVPQFMLDWVNGYKALAFVGAPLVIAGMSRRVPLLVKTGITLLSIYFIACGFAHFKWADGVQYMVPEYIPFRLFWTYFTGMCLLAGGIGLMITGFRKWSAFMLGLMVFGWLLLLHIPEFIATHQPPTMQGWVSVRLSDLLEYAGWWLVFLGVHSQV